MNFGQLFANCALWRTDVLQSVAKYVARDLSTNSVIYLINAEISTALSIVLFYFSNGRYIDYLSLTYATGNLSG